MFSTEKDNKSGKSLVHTLTFTHCDLSHWTGLWMLCILFLHSDNAFYRKLQHNTTP